MKIIAHRGASFAAPENTLAAFRLALDEGADGVELDVRLTADKRIIALHDVTTARTSDMLMRADMSFYDQIRACDAGSWKSSKFKDEHVPVLEEVFQMMPASKDVFIEVKCGKEIIPYLSELLQEYPGHVESAVVFSFSYDVCVEARKNLSGCRVLWIGEFGYNIELHPEMYNRTAKMVTDANLDGFSTRAELLHVSSMRKRLKDLHLNVWTVDSEEDAVSFRDMGVDSLTTNRPDRIIEALF